MNSNLKKMWVAAAALVLVAAAGTAWAEPLSVNEAFEAAKADNRSYRLALKQFREFVWEENTVNPFAPTLALTGSVTTGASFLPSVAFSGVGYSVGASASFSLGPSVYTDREVKEADNQSAFLEFEASEKDLYRAVSTAYLNVLLYRGAVDVSERSLGLAMSQWKAAEDSYNAGECSELVMRQAENAYKSELFTHEQNRSYLVSAEKAFDILTGLEVASYELQDLDDLALLDLPETSEIFFAFKEKSLSVRSAKNSVNVADISLKSARNSAYVPTVTLSAAYTNRASGLASASSTGVNDSLSATVGFSLPMSGYLTGSSAAASIRKAENEAENARIRLEAAYSDLESSIDEIVSSIDLTVSQIGLLEERRETLRYQRDLSENAYENGLISLSDLRDVYDDLEEGEYALLSAKVSYISAVNTLAVLLGTDGEAIYTIF